LNCEDVLKLEAFILVIKNGRLRWTKHVSHTNDANLIKHCKRMGVKGTR